MSETQARVATETVEPEAPRARGPVHRLLRTNVVWTLCVLLGKLGVLDKAKMRKQAYESFTSMGTDVKDVDAPVASLSGGQRQSVAICRSVMWANELVFMDEPTAALGVRQTRKVLELIRRVAGTGVAVVLISHNMPEVLEVADRVEVLRLGHRVAQFKAADTNVEELVGAMTGALDGARA